MGHGEDAKVDKKGTGRKTQQEGEEQEEGKQAVEVKGSPAAKLSSAEASAEANDERRRLRLSGGASEGVRRASGAGDEQGPVCSICGCPDPCAPSSCPNCTVHLLSESNAFNLTLEQRVWCRGFGPSWPARIEAIGFQAVDDPQPFWVKFYGENNFAWVGEKNLAPWASRKPPALGSLPAKFRRRMASALEEANAEIEEEAAWGAACPESA